MLRSQIPSERAVHVKLTSRYVAPDGPKNAVKVPLEDSDEPPSAEASRQIANCLSA